MGQELQKEDEEKAKKKVIKKKSSEKKATAKKSSPKKALAELNSEDFDGNRCFARKWEAESGLGYDSIQCSSCKKVSKDEAEKVLVEFKDKMNEAQLENMGCYIEKYDGCFCKIHLKQDFFMPNGWWLGKVNEDRPEKPMLPKGSLKDGYRDDYKEHFWMYDSEGKKVEKSSKKKIVKKKKKTEEPDAKVEKPKKKKIIKKKKKIEEPKDEPKPEVEVVEEPKPEVEVVEEPKPEVETVEEPKPEVDAVEEPKPEVEVVEEPKPEVEVVEEPKDEIETVEEPKPEVEVVEEPKPEIETVEEPKPEIETVEEPEDEEDDDKTEPLSSDDESYEAEEYIVDGTEYMKVWDEDEKMWVIVDPESQEMVGFPDGNGDITPV